MKKYIALLAALGMAGLAHAGQSDYTNISQFPVSHAAFDEPVHIEKCQSLDKNYTIKTSSHNLRTSLSVAHGSHRTMYSPMQNHYLGDKLEWRYHLVGGKKYHYASIYRMFIDSNVVERLESDEHIDTKHQLSLIVIGLRGDDTCVIGVVPAQSDMNITARQIADNPKAACLELD